MSNQAQIDNMMRSFSQIDKVQPKVDLETEKQFQEVYDIIEESELNYEMEKLNLQPKVKSTPKPQQKIMKKDSQTIVLILFALAFYTNAVWSVFSNDFPALILSGTMCLLFAGIATYSALKN
jgi:hypothetical protein